MSDAELWRNGHSLDLAWFHFGDADLKEQYRDAGQDPARTEFLTSMMKRDLRFALQRGELLAFGVQMPAAVDSRPALLPFVIFDHAEEIEWEASIVRNHGLEFRSVRISEPLDLPVDQPEPIRKPAKKMGRPSAQPFLREIVLELATNRNFGRLPTKERIALVAEKARERDSERFRSEGQPARQTVIKALQAAGFWGPKS